MEIKRNENYVKFVNESYKDDKRLREIILSKDFYQDEKLLEAEKVYRFGKLLNQIRTLNYNLVELIEDQ